MIPALISNRQLRMIRKGVNPYEQPMIARLYPAFVVKPKRWGRWKKWGG